MPGRRLLLLPALALLATVALFMALARGPAPREEPAASAVPEAPGAAQHERAGAPALPEVSAPASPSTLRAPSQAEQPPEPPAESAFEAPVAGGVEVLVLDREGDVPVPGATVLFLDWDALGPEQVARVSGCERDFERACALVGRRFRTDEQGLARVPQPKLGAQLAAASPGRWGIGFAHRGATERAIVRLADDVQLPVRVVDRSGRPVAGAVVALRVRDAHNVSDLLRATSGADGLARLDHVQAQREESQGQELTVALVLLAREPVELALEPALLERGTTAPVELVLPDTGTLEVELARDAATPGRCSVGLTLDPEAPVEAGVKQPRLPGLALPPGATSACFEHVGLGLPLVVGVDGPGLAHTEARTSGPQVAGEVVRMSVALDADSPPAAIVGRLLDATGAPLARVQIPARLLIARGLTRMDVSTTLETDGDGSFRLPLKPPLEAGAQASLRLSHGSLGCTLVLPPPDGQGVVALGDVQLVERPLLVAGHVVDERGEPVGGAVIELSRRVSADDSSWQLVAGLDASSDASGAFAVRAESDAPELALSASCAGHVAVRWSPFTRGARDLAVVLPRGGAAVGRLLWPERARAEDFVLLFVPSRAPESPFSVRLRSDGGFELSGVPAGEGRLRVQLGHEGERVLELDGLDLPPGAVSSDPRLEPLDLRGLVSVHELSVVDAEAHAITRVEFTREAAGGEPAAAPLLAEPEAGGTYRIVSGSEIRGLDVRAPGYRPARLASLTSDQTVVLARGFVVELEVRGLSAELMSEFAWGVRLEALTAEGSESPDPHANDLVELATARTAIPLSGPGPHRARLFAARRAPSVPGGIVSGDRDWHAIELAGEPVIDVQDVHPAQSLSVELRGDTLASSLAKLRGGEH